MNTKDAGLPIFSCVLDNKPTFAAQARVWALSLLRCAGIAPDRLVIHHTKACQEKYLERLQPLGVRFEEVEMFDSRHGPSNKLAQLESAYLADAESVILCDCDIAFGADISAVAQGSPFRAKIVDLAELTPDLWTAIFSAAGLEAPPLDAVATTDKQPTLINYCNGGLLIISGDLFKKLGSVWPKWNRWLLDRPDLLGSCYKYADQISMALSLQELGVRNEPLDPIYNYPTHDFGGNPETKSTPQVIHYHKLDASGFLARTNNPPADSAIDSINAMLVEAYRESFDNGEFWDFRYATSPGLGSGVGSRGHDLLVKRRLLEYYIDSLKPESVLDIGCGDLEVTRELRIGDYLGIDISEEAVKIAKEKRPYWRFQSGDISELDIEPRDLVLCFDVLIHQRTEDQYRRLVRRLKNLAKRYLIVAGHNQPPGYSPIVFYHESLWQTLSQGNDGYVCIIGGYGNTTVFLYSKVGVPDWGAPAPKRTSGLRRFLSRVKRKVLAVAQR